MSNLVGDIVWGVLLAAWLYGISCMLIHIFFGSVKNKEYKKIQSQPDSLMNFVKIEIRFKQE